MKGCAYSLIIFSFFTSHIFPRRAQTSPRGGNAAHRAAYRSTPALLRRARPRISGRNKIPEKHRRVFAADSRFRNRFPCGAKPAAGFGCGKIPFGRAALSRAAGTDGRATVGICGRSAAVRFRFAAAQPGLLRPQDKKCRRAKNKRIFRRTFINNNRTTKAPRSETRRGPGRRSPRRFRTRAEPPPARTSANRRGASRARLRFALFRWRSILS